MSETHKRAVYCGELRPQALRKIRDALASACMQNFALEADVERQVLRVYFRGIVTAERLRDAVEPSVRRIAELAPGFTVVADLSELEEMEIDCVPHITRLMDEFRNAGVGRVIRVIPNADKDIGFTLLSHTHYRGKVPFETVESAAELDQALRARR